jgi:transposase-like protein
MNIPKLRGKMVEAGYSVESLANKIGVDKSTLYRKLDNGEKFTIGEAQKIRTTLDLTNDEAAVIFFGQ